MLIHVTELLDEKNVDKQEQRWHQAIRDMGATVPFWSYHAERLKLTMCRGWNQTAAVDGVNLFWNPEFTASLTDKQLLFLLTHEVFHVAAGHLWRGQRYIKGLTNGDLHREASISNEAMDYAIHQVVKPLIDNGYYDMEWISCGLYDPKYDRQSFESIRLDLKANPKIDVLGEGGLGGASGGGEGGQQVLDIHIMRGSGDAPEGALEGQDGSWVLIVDQDGNLINPGEDDPKPEPMDPNGLRRQISREIKDAKLEKTGRGYGNGDSTKTGEVDAKGKSEQNWDILKRFVLQCAQSDYSYAKPNRGYLSRGVIVPGLKSGVLKLKIAIDTSGSINKALLNRFGLEVEGIRSQLGDHELEIITCSMSIPKGGDGREKTQVVRTGEDIDWKITKGGGTSFVPVFDYVANQGDSPACLLYFTDLEGTFPKYQPEYPVLWAVPSRCYCTAPFGEIVKLSPQ